MTNLAIAANGLTKSYRDKTRGKTGDKVVLDGIDLTVPQGTIFSLLGPNGAGKTTTVQILSTLTKADSGHAQVAGYDLNRQADDVRGAIGVTGQYSAIDKLLTGEENLLLMADLKHLPKREGKQKATELLEQFDLTEAARKTATTYSGGMARRLDLAMTLIGDPHLIFLDEPTTGLDPRSRRAMWDIVRDLAKKGVTIFLTTQYLDEADELADRIAVLDHGHLIAEGTPDELKRLIPGGHVLLKFTDTSRLDAAGDLLGAATPDHDALTLQVPSDGSVRAIRELLTLLDERSIDVAEMSVHTPDLDDVFLTLTGPQNDQNTQQTDQNKKALR
jgi:ABC-2 type transport system ATP-binding protein